MLDGGRRLAATLGARILLADDNADMRDYVRRLLRAQLRGRGRRATAQAALDAARAAPPDLVLTDVMMPRLDGFGLLRALRADPQLRSVPVILLSARAGEEARIEGLDAGADDYLVKPFTARELLARVGSHSRARRSMRRAAERGCGCAPRSSRRCSMRRRSASTWSTPISAFARSIPPPGRVRRHSRDLDRPRLRRSHPPPLGEAYADEIVRHLPPHAGDRRALRHARARRAAPDRGVTEYYEWRLDRIPLPDGRYGVVCYFRDISAQVQAEKTRKLLLERAQSSRQEHARKRAGDRAADLAQHQGSRRFRARFSGRIQSMARAHSLLTNSTWQGADLDASSATSCCRAGR